MSKKVAVVMAAGKGTRMKSELPKVLIPVCGRPMIEYVLEALGRAELDEILVVVGYRADDVKAGLRGWPRVKFVLQAEQLGTGHAVMVCREHLKDHVGPVLIVAGDSPLMQPPSIAALFAEYDRSQPACILGTGYKDNPTGLGRVVRDAQGNFQAIVEEKDATPAQKQIREVNLSCYVFHAPDLLLALDQIRADNAQREYYLTDCPGVLKAAGKNVRVLDVLQPCEALSINTAAELAAVEEVLRGLADRQDQSATM
jgi:bifunctional UDP-N-acetylglucosamine pyrophosphorylase/glucosamine-1-phosphate N-acetyltransferase/UDP-N-acetylglucosamine pyrophosphorylase